MDFRIGDLVLCGFVSHSSPYCVHGQLMLRGDDGPFVFELTGEPAPDLRGRNFEFSIPGNEREPSEEDRRRARAFAPQQVGATGDMTAARRVRTYDSPPEEVGRPTELTGTLHQCLYLEWHSQNGRVVLEAVDAEIHFFENDNPPDSLKLPPDDDYDADLPPFGDSPEEEIGSGKPHDFAGATDELDQELEAAARQLDREISGETAEGDEALQEFAEFDDLLANGPEIPIGSLLTHLPLPPPTPELPAPEAAAALAGALGQLALFSIAFHICEHCSIQDAYRIFVQDVCALTTFMPAMNARGFVQHFTTSDFCPVCRA